MCIECERKIIEKDQLIGMLRYEIRRLRALRTVERDRILEAVEDRSRQRLNLIDAVDNFIKVNAPMWPELALDFAPDEEMEVGSKSKGQM